MRSRPEPLAVTLVAVLALGVTSASATLALREAGSVTMRAPAAELPAVLFSPEPVAPVAPVSSAISADDPSNDSVALAAPPPVPSPRAQAAPKAGPVKAKAAAVAPEPPRIQLTLGYVQAQLRNRDIIIFTATVRNDAPVPVQGLVLSTHVPTGTRWRADAPCRGESRPLALSYGDGSPVVVCVPVPKGGGSDDPATHQVVAVFDRPVAPGGTVTARYAVEVAPGVRTVVNHVHLTGPGIDGQSPPLTVEVS